VDAVGDFLGQRLVDGAVALDPGEGLERVRDDGDGKMRFARPVRIARVAGVQRAVIADIQVPGREGPGQRLLDARFHL